MFPENADAVAIQRNITLLQQELSKPKPHLESVISLKGVDLRECGKCCKHCGKVSFLFKSCLCKRYNVMCMQNCIFISISIHI